MFKSGFVTLIGKPNVGKSTLTNALVGEKVSIVTFRPQTTRDKIVGIVNGDDYQIVLLDTPGIHNAKNGLSKFMMKSVESALEGIDVLIYVIACDKKLLDEEIEQIKMYASNKKVPFIVAINKCDIDKGASVGEKIEALKDIENIKAIIPISAMQGKNIEDLKNEILKYLKEGVKYYDDDMYTDRNLRFMVSEYIREKAIRLLGDELPYGIGISINKFSERENGIVDIDADIVCEKAAHKAMIIGKQGKMIKEISTQSRIDIERLLDQKVFLTLYVRVKEDWRDNDLLLNNLGYNIKKI